LGGFFVYGANIRSALQELSHSLRSGRPLRFILTGREAHDITTAPQLLADLSAGGVIADKAYDCNALRDVIAEAGARAVNPIQNVA
jgi:transposase